MSADINLSISEDGPLSIMNPLSLNGLRINAGKMDIVYPHLKMEGLAALELESIR
jgi:hypothetical protein